MTSVVCPCIADLNTTGSGTIESQKLATKPVHSVDMRFSTSASVNDVNSIWYAFDISDNVTADGSSNFTVYLDAEAFKTALRTHMNAALGGRMSGRVTTSSTDSPANSATLKATMDSEVEAEIRAFLNNNDVDEYLEGDYVSGLNLAVDYSGGAANMYDAINTENKQNILKSIVLQIPKRNTTAGGDFAETVQHYTRLPVKAGDSISFVFDLKTAITLTQVDKDAPTIAAGATGTAGGAGYAEGSTAPLQGGSSSGSAYDTQITTYFGANPYGSNAISYYFTTGVRRVEFRITANEDAV